MHKMIFLAPLLLAGCSTAPAAPAAPADPAAAPAEPVSPVHGETPGHTCTADGTDQFVGQTRTDEVGAAIKRVSNAAVVRWAPPGVMLTMDYRADRVTIWLDPANKITKIRCG